MSSHNTPPNGGEQEARLASLEREREEFRRDMKLLLTAQVLQKGEIEDLLKVTQEHSRKFEAEEQARREKDGVLDKRVDDLVSAIGEFIRRLPPPPPQS